MKELCSGTLEPGVQASVSVFKLCNEVGILDRKRSMSSENLQQFQIIIKELRWLESVVEVDAANDL